MTTDNLLAMLTQTATVTKRTQDDEDEFGDPQMVDGSSIEYPCRLEQPSLISDSGENLAAMDRVVTRYVCYMPPGAQVDHLDEVTIQGKTFEVVGEPALNRDRTGPHHTVVTLRDILGG